MEDLTAVHIFISGRVQGVFYRSWMQKTAKNMELTGWVKNLEDGRVEAIIQGTEDKVDEFIKLCKDGSKFAKVESVDVEKTKINDDLSNFQIKY